MPKKIFKNLNNEKTLNLKLSVKTKINKKVSFIIESQYNRPINNNFNISNNKIIIFHDNITFK